MHQKEQVLLQQPKHALRRAAACCSIDGLHCMLLANWGWGSSSGLRTSMFSYSATPWSPMDLCGSMPALCLHTSEYVQRGMFSQEQRILAPTLRPDSPLTHPWPGSFPAQSSHEPTAPPSPSRWFCYAQQCLWLLPAATPKHTKATHLQHHYRLYSSWCKFHCHRPLIGWGHKTWKLSSHCWSSEDAASYLPWKASHLRGCCFSMYSWFLAACLGHFPCYGMTASQETRHWFYYLSYWYCILSSQSSLEMASGSG